MSIGRIPHRTLAGIDKTASRLALGFEFFDSLDAASVTLDSFWQAGGNVFDTAYIYAGGKTERIFGEWHRSRGLARDDFVLIGKGAHSPDCFPDRIGKQLGESLERLQIDYVDVYMMHRDNQSVPAAEFVDALDVEIRAGRIRGIVGGSNWNRERMDEARAYAGETGKVMPTAISNNFGLAEMLDPIWPGCVSAFGPKWRQWQEANAIINFAWSSQARGFFTERAGRDKTEDEELVRVWYSERNFARRDRAVELAGRLGCKPIHIALAYVLAQQFAVVPLIGPRSGDELTDSLRALDIKLSAAELLFVEA